MGRLGLPELLVILAIVIVIFGANRLPDLGRGIGDAIRGFKDGMKTDERRQGRQEPQGVVAAVTARSGCHPRGA